MQPFLDGIEPLFLDSEKEWCRAHREVPEALCALRAYEELDRIPEDEERKQAVVDAVRALRKIRPRPKMKIDCLYAWVALNPRTKVEGLLGPYKGGMVQLLVGCDLDRMRSTLIDAIAMQADIPTRMKLYKFDIERVIPNHKIPHIRSHNSLSKTVQEIFAFVSTLKNGDEMITAHMTDIGIQMLLDGRPDKIQEYAESLKKGISVPTELRRFLRSAEVTGPEWEIGEPAKFTDLSHIVGL